ncbi:hypothetical protein CBR_g47982 [Chara braunii]|uniref:Reverse transcriptase domain-containing protein n=1 Tax=Chara braunii TaxID=69332 RepID=A0A388M1T0_CHABU|nr:hypothetical protein CBR_g47982 [Chara braunii]|eukprot:GBG88511.1 hypothetical protein CBR_g47982 [Chara braunii]
MPEEMADGGRRLVTLDDLIDALDKRERAPSNVPKVETFHFNGDRVSDWLDLIEQALGGLLDEVKLQRVLRKYRLGDGLLTMADLEAMNKEDFSTIGAFVHEFKKKARKVHGISEEAQCATFLGLLTGSEATKLTKYGEGSERLTWATIDKGVGEGSLDQVEQHQMRLQRRKRKERDATASGTPGVKRIVTNVLAALGYDNEAEIQKKGVLVAQGRASGVVDEEVGQEDYGGGETDSQVLTKALRKQRNLLQGGQGSGKGQAPQAIAAPPPVAAAAPTPAGSSHMGPPPACGHWDLQRLNAVTMRDAGGLPNTDALSKSCAGRPIISLIDLYSGYDQFPVYPSDRPVTAMHMPRGLIHMNVAPQGWTNAVVMVQRHMIRAMQTVSPHITEPYIDDLAVKGSKEKEEDEVMLGVRRFVWKHIQDIDQVLGLLEEHNLTASGPKSKHCMREATILGFVCNEKGRRPDVKKTDKILEWPVPFQSITNVRSFLGTCGFWRSFVKDFATKTEHLRKLVRQDQEWVWGEDQEKVVERMKGEFKEGGLVLGAPNYEATEEKPFIVETDAGPTALGGVLIQADADGKERPLRFESRTLNTTERNYSQFKKETLARLRAFPRGRHGTPIRLEEGNTEEFIPAYEHYMLSQGIAREEWVQALLIWTRGAERPVAKLIRERARDWEDCQAQLRRAFGWPERERHEPRVERRRRSKRPREPAPREVGLPRERRRAPAQREDEPTRPALAEESFPACGLRAVEFRRITSEELRPPSPLPSAQELDIPRETPFRSLATHLDVSRWEASRLGEGSVEPTCYVSLEEPLDPETETDMRDREEPQDPKMAAEQPDPVRPQGREVITVGDDTPPRSPVPEPAQHSWPEGIPEPGSEEIPESPPEATAMPEQEAEAEDQGVGERARVETPLDLPSAMHVTRSPVIGGPVPAELPPAVPCTSEGMGAEASTPEGQGPRVRRTPRETREEKSARVRVRLDEIHARQAEMEAAGIEPTPPVEPKTSERRIDELWARYESQRDAARQRSRDTGQADEEAGELREMGDLGFSATRMAIERVDRKICETAVTSFQWYNLLSGELRVKELEVGHLTMRARNRGGYAHEISRRSDPDEGAWWARPCIPNSLGAAASAARAVSVGTPLEVGTSQKGWAWPICVDGMREPKVARADPSVAAIVVRSAQWARMPESCKEGRLTGPSEDLRDVPMRRG